MPTVFYDADCSICTNGARRFGRILARRGIALEALQAGDVCERLRISEDERLAEMRLRLDEGTVFGGAAALAEIARRIWWAWPVWAISRLPGVMPSMRAAYRWLAGHRAA